VDFGSLSLGEKIAAGSGAALLIFLFPSWIGGESAWELFRVVHVLLAILALVALGIPLAKAAGYNQQLRPSDRAILTRVGTVALVFVLAYFLEALDRAEVGLWLSVFAAAGIFYGGITTPGEEAAHRRRDRTRRPLAEGDYEERPPGMEDWRRGPPPLDDEGEGEAGPGYEGPERRRYPEDPEPSRDPEPPRGAESTHRRETGFGEPTPEFEITERRPPRRRPPEA
jgi:hypothetical protein